MSYTLQEIESQPDIWRSTLLGFKKTKSDMERDLKKLKFSRILVIGCGSTYYLARSAAFFLSRFTRYVVQACPSSEVWLLPWTLPDQDTLLLVFSRSGTTTESIKAVEQFRSAGGNQVITITCDPESPLAVQAEIALVAPAAKELSVVQTRSFTSMYILMMAFAFTFGGRSDLLKEMDQLPGNLEEVVSKFGHWPKEWASTQQFEKFFFLGNGPLYGLACEAMLKVKEMSLSWTEAYHTLEFRHGPMSLVDDHTLIVGSISDATRQPELDVLRDAQKLGASIVLCDIDLPFIFPWTPEYYVSPSSEINDWLRGILYLPLMQRLGYYRALANDQSPDNPRNLQQVVKL